MFIIIGPEKTLKIKDIVGIFDIDSASSTKVTKAFLVKCEREGRVHGSGGELPKSFLVTVSGDVYFSQYSAKVLKARTEGDFSYFLERK